MRCSVSICERKRNRAYCLHPEFNKTLLQYDILCQTSYTNTYIWHFIPPMCCVNIYPIFVPLCSVWAQPLQDYYKSMYYLLSVTPIYTWTKFIHPEEVDGTLFRKFRTNAITLHSLRMEKKMTENHRPERLTIYKHMCTTVLQIQILHLKFTEHIP
jgi:hypothetical protein